MVKLCVNVCDDMYGKYCGRLNGIIPLDVKTALKLMLVM